jgi:hypothetical protein
MPNEPRPAPIKTSTAIALFATWFDASRSGDYERAARFRVELLRDFGVMVNRSRASRSDRRP